MNIFSAFENKFVDDVIGDDGECSTCSLGATKGMSRAAFEALLHEIDAFVAEEFSKERRRRLAAQDAESRLRYPDRTGS